MNRVEAIKLLVKLSSQYGNDPMLVQGAGGNTSVKFDSGKMIVKASGALLKTVTESSGWVEVPHNEIARFVRNGPEMSSSLVDFDSHVDDKLALDVDQVTEKSNQKASIEAAMHAVLKKIVVHVHPILTNILLCSTDAQDVCKAVFQGLSFAWIGPLPPGYYLARAISDAVEANQLAYFPNIILLASHGIIVHADTEEEVHLLYQDILKRCEDWLADNGAKLSDASFTSFLPDWQSETKENDIFPDTVVFKKIAQNIDSISTDKRNGIIETYAASKMIRFFHKKLNLKSLNLSKNISDYILGMSREKHRQNVATKPSV